LSCHVAWGGADRHSQQMQVAPTPFQLPRRRANTDDTQPGRQTDSSDTSDSSAVPSLRRIVDGVPHVTYTQMQLHERENGIGIRSSCLVHQDGGHTHGSNDEQPHNGRKTTPGGVQDSMISVPHHRPFLGFRRGGLLFIERGFKTRA
jgi:hypothetical protein